VIVVATVKISKKYKKKINRFPEDGILND